MFLKRFALIGEIDGGDQRSTSMTSDLRRAELLLHRKWVERAQLFVVKVREGVAAAFTAKEPPRLLVCDRLATIQYRQLPLIRVKFGRVVARWGGGAVDDDDRRTLVLSAWLLQLDACLARRPDRLIQARGHPAINGGAVPDQALCACCWGGTLPRGGDHEGRSERDHQA